MHSQLGQDFWVLDFLNYKKKGIFIEIGASNGISLSNTYLLESEYEWGGICVEPSRQFQFLKSNRYCLCLDAVLWHSDDEEITFIEDYKNGEENWFSGIKYQFDCHEVEGIEYPKTTKTLQSILEENDFGKHIDYLSIDTEGSEYDIIKNFPFSNFEIDLITIEHNYVEPKRQKIYELLCKNGYIRQEIIDTQFDDWYYHERLLSSSQFLIKRQEELYKKTFELKNSENHNFRQLQNQNSELQNQNSELQNQNSELQNQNSELQNQNLELQNQNLELQNQNSELQNQNVALLNSISWKISSPLRYLGKYLGF